MTEIKARLQGGVQEKKKSGAERLKTILEEIKSRGVVTESDLATATGLDKATLEKYLFYLSENGLVTVNKRIFRDPEISAIGGRQLKVPQRPPEVKETQPEPQPATEPPKQESAPPQPPAAAPPEDNPPQQEPTEQLLPSEQLEQLEKTQPEPALPKEEPAAQKQAPEPQPPPQKPAQTPQPPPEVVGQAKSTGEKIVPSSEAELKEVCQSLVTDFIGVMRLFGEVQGQSYTAGLLIDKGDVVAVSLEHMDTVEIQYGDEAIRQLQARFAGTKGDLEIYEMSEEDLNESVRKNINSTLTAPVKLSSMKIKIKSRTKGPEEAQKKSMLSSITGMFTYSDPKAKEERLKAIKDMQKRKVEKLEGGLNLVDFARNLAFDPVKAKRFEELRKARQVPGQQPQAAPEDPRKAARLEELKAQRMQGGGLKSMLSLQGGGQTKEERLEKLKQARKIQPLAIEKEDKTPVKTVKEGKKVETSIDKFYEYVKSQGKVKLNDALSAKLKVNKTQLEAWAMVLEEHSLLELRYPTIGEPEVAYNSSEKPVKKDDADGHKKR